MKKVRVLVVEDDNQQRQGIVDFLRARPDIEVVGEAADGQVALRLMAEQQPDVVLLDMVLQGMDGWETLRQMRERDMDLSKVIVVTAINTEHHIARASQYGVGSYMLKPFYDLRMLHRRILDVAKGFAVPEPESPAQVEKRSASVPEDVGGVMLAIGVPAHVKGFLYLREAIRRAAGEVRLLGRLTTELYPGVARKFETTPKNVERAMRNAIELAWTRTSQEKLDTALGVGIASAELRPSTGEFIALLVNWQRTREAGA